MSPASFDIATSIGTSTRSCCKEHVAIHAIVTRGVFLANGQWHPIPYVDTHKAELAFRHKLLRLLRDRDLISEERIDLLLSWRHSGFNIHNHTTVYGTCQRL